MSDPDRRMTHAERRARRQAMAAAVAAGESGLEVAARFGVDPKTVQTACRAAGVESQRGRRLSLKTLEILAALVQTDEPVASIAARFAVSRTYLYALRGEALRAGFLVPPRDGERPGDTSESLEKPPD